MNNNRACVVILVFSSVLLLARALYSQDGVGAQIASATGDTTKGWTENGYRFVATPSQLSDVGATCKLFSPDGRLLLKTRVGTVVDKELILPFTPAGDGIFLAGYPDLIAVSATSCGNKCTYQVSFYRVSTTAASAVGTFETYARVGKLQDLDHDGFPEIVKIEVFYGLWGGGWNSPGVPAVFALDKTTNRYRHAEKRFYQTWLEEEKHLETAVDAPKERELSHHFFLAVDALLKRDGTSARNEYVKAERLAREVYPEAKMPTTEQSWGRLVTDIGPWMLTAGEPR